MLLVALNFSIAVLIPAGLAIASTLGLIFLALDRR
jgi:hypothetical protein